MNNQLKIKISNSSPTIGGWLTTLSPVVAEAMAMCDFDWIAIDMEHGPADEASVPAIFMAFALHGVAPIVRLPSADPYMARRMLDLGATGLIVPVVESAEDFAEFSSHCRYPPNGNRGVGLSRANQWGISFETYVNNFQPVLIPQIETRKGVEAAPSIVTLDCVDGLFVGPYDLSADLGAAGAFEAPTYTQALETILAASADAGKACGIHQVEPDIAALKKKLDEGYRFIAFGTDMIAMQHAFQGLSDLS